MIFFDNIVCKCFAEFLTCFNITNTILRKATIKSSQCNCSDYKYKINMPLLNQSQKTTSNHWHINSVQKNLFFFTPAYQDSLFQWNIYPLLYFTPELQSLGIPDRGKERSFLFEKMERAIKKKFSEGFLQTLPNYKILGKMHQSLLFISPPFLIWPISCSTYGILAFFRSWQMFTYH